MREARYDAVIVGGGIAGALVAERLLAAGMTVALLEAGAETSGESGEGWEAYLAHYHANPLKTPNSPYPENRAAPSPSVLDTAKIGAEPSTKGYFVQRGPNPFGSNYLRALGGTTLHWLGTCLRMTPADFEMATRYGRGVDWPISYADLAPWYERAEWAIGVSGEVEDQGYHGIAFSPGYAYPMRRIPQSFNDRFYVRALDGATLAVDGARLPITVSSTPQGRNSTPRAGGAIVAGEARGAYEARGGSPDYVFRGARCEGNSSCIPICPVKAKYSALKTLGDCARLWPQTFTLLKQCVVSRLEHDPDSGAVTGVLYKRYEAPDAPYFETRAIRGRIVVLAANAVENAKLGLASGLRDPSGQLGGNLMDHPFLLSWGLAPEPVGPFRGPGATSGIESLRDGAFRRDRAACRVEIGNWGWNFATGAPFSDVNRLVDEGFSGAALRARLRHDVQRQVRLGALIEQPPDPDNRVSIDPRWRDALGEPRPVIDYHLDAYTRAGLALGRDLCAEAFRVAGVEDHTAYDRDLPGYVEHEGRGFAYFGSGHLVGTHRIGAYEGAGVTDADLRMWRHPNLWMVGAGAMPTIGTSNPTLTLAALALKAADAMVAAMETTP